MTSASNASGASSVERRKVGIFGGTFDPIHLGHLVAASEAASVVGLDAVIFVPTGRPWQKADSSVTAAEHRIRMAELATQGDPRFSVSRVDVDRPGPTYTVDTVRDLESEHPDVDWYFLAGADSLKSLPTWKDAAEIAAKVRLVGLTRPGYDLVAPEIVRNRPVILVQMPGIDISSRMCRARVRDGAPVRYLLPDAVADYVASHRLYVEAGAAPAPRQ